MRVKFGYVGEGFKGTAEIDDALLATLSDGAAVERASIDLPRSEPTKAIVHLGGKGWMKVKNIPRSEIKNIIEDP